MKNKKIIAILFSVILLLSMVFPSFAGNLKAGDEITLGGMPFGIKIMSRNMTVSGFTDVDGEEKSFSPAYDAGMRENDIILKVNGKNINKAEDVTKTVENSNGNNISFLCKRNKEKITINVLPIKSKSTGEYKIGVWIKDSTAGIGTVTYIDNKTGEFGGLGHGICSSDSGDLIPMTKGTVNAVTITGINKGEIGTPGELKGYFGSEKIGFVTSNTDCGVFGTLTDVNLNGNYNKTVKIANKEEIRTGKATILCTLSENKIKEYNVEIVCNEGDKETKSFSVVVTDPSLIALTGGIVQGMSGSPIIQNGKLVGAVTHVLVNDPTRGYGIFIENMLETANQVAEEQAKKDAS